MDTDDFRGSPSSKRRQRRRKKRVLPSGWERFDRLLPGMLATLVVGSLLAVGTVHLLTLLIVAPLALILGAGATWLELRSGRHPPLPMFVLLALSLYSLLQAIPLPFELLQRIAPKNAEIWSGAYALLEEKPAAVCLSLDPGGSLIESLKWASYTAAFAAAVRVGRRFGARYGATVIFYAALLSALATLIHGIFGAKLLFGFYEPSADVKPWALSPLLNSNSYAGYLNLGVFCGMGLFAARRTKVPSALIGLGIALVVALSALSASRAGLAALAAGVPILCILYARVHRRDPRLDWRRTFLLPVATILSAGVAFAALGGGIESWSELLGESADKLLLTQWALPMVSDFPFLGAGRGAFESVFSAYAAPKVYVRHAHAENFVAQWAAEWGVPVTLSALLVLIWSFRPGRLRVHASVVAASAYTGVLVLLAQNLLDLALEIPSVCLALAVLLGSMSGGALHREPGGERAFESPSRWTLRSGQLSLAALMAAFILVPIVAASARPVFDERERLHKLFAGLVANAKDKHADFWRELEESIRGFPADPYFPMLAGLAELRTQTGKPLRWLGRAIERDPMSGRPYLILGSALASLGAQDQALHALSMAAGRERFLIGPVARRALSITRDPVSLQRAVPEGEHAWVLWVAMARKIRPDALRLRFFQHAVEDATPGASEPRLLLAAQLLDAVEKSQTECHEDRAAACLSRTAMLLDGLRRDSSSKARRVVLRARWLRAAGRAPEASQLLERECPRLSDRADCLREKVKASLAMTTAEEFEGAAEEYLQVACGPPERCSKAAAWIASLYGARHDWARAAGAYRRAADLASSSNLWLKAAEAANRAGKPTDALHALQQAERLRRREP